MWRYSAFFVVVSLSAASLGIAASSGMDQAAPEAIVGRWNITIQTPEGTRPSWLEIRRSGRSTFVGRFVGMVGSARPISRIEVSGGGMRFSIPPQ